MVFVYATLGLLALGQPSATSQSLAQAVARNLHHFKHKQVMEQDNHEAVRVEVKAVVRNKDFQGERSMHKGRHGKDYGSDYGAEEACPSWCYTIPAADRHWTPACVPCSPKFEEEYSSRPHGDGGETFHHHAGKSEMEQDDGEAVRVEVKAVVRDSDWQGDRMMHKGRAVHEGEKAFGDAESQEEAGKMSRTWHHKGRSEEEQDDDEAVRVEVKAVVRNKDFQGEKSMHKGRHEKDFGPGPAMAPPALEAAEACAAYCQYTPRLTQQYDPNCAQCPGAGTAPTGTPCEARCGYSPSTSWQYDPGCTGCH